MQLTAANDDQYFVFEDSLYQALLTFSRDVTLLDLFGRSSKSPLTAVVKGKGGHTEGSVIYPPNGIVPFHGFTMYGMWYVHVPEFIKPFMDEDEHFTLPLVQLLPFVTYMTNLKIFTSHFGHCTRATGIDSMRFHPTKMEL